MGMEEIEMSDSDDVIVRNLTIGGHSAYSPDIIEINVTPISKATSKRDSNIYRRGTKTQWTDEQIIEYQNELEHEIQRQRMKYGDNVPEIINIDDGDKYDSEGSDDDVLSEVNTIGMGSMTACDGSHTPTNVSDMFSTPIPTQGDDETLGVIKLEIIDDSINAQE